MAGEGTNALPSPNNAGAALSDEDTTTATPPPPLAPLSSSREALDIVCELSDLLDVGLDRRALRALVELLEAGVNPEALAAAVSEMRREVVGGRRGGGGRPTNT